MGGTEEETESAQTSRGRERSLVEGRQEGKNEVKMLRAPLLSARPDAAERSKTSVGWSVGRLLAACCFSSSVI